ncbi:hypothetical protein Tco_0348392 [Tanacetum coccineum]
MTSPRFTKVIINHFISKDKTIFMRNRINLHTICNDSLLAIKNSKAYKTYYDFATGKAPPKKARKYKKVASPSRILSHILEEELAKKPNGSGDEVGSQPKVPDESEDKTTSTDEGTNSGDDESNDDDSDEVTKDDDEDDVKSDANEDEEASDSEKTYSNGDENLNVNQNYNEKEEHDDDSFEFNDDDDEEYDALYKDVNMRLKVAEHKEVGKGDAEMTDTTHESLKQSSSVPSDFASKFLNLDNIPPVGDEVASLMNVKTPHEESRTQAPLILSVPVTAILETSTVNQPTTSSILALPYFASLFGFNKRVSALEQELYQVKQVDHSAQILAIVDEHISTRIGFSTQIALQSYTAEFENKAQAEKEKYINIIEKSVKEIIKDEVNFLRSYLRRFMTLLLLDKAKSRVELKFHFKEYYKAVTDKLDWTNPEGHEYPLDLSKPLPLIEDQGRQVLHDIASSLEMDYLPKIRWSKLDRKRCRIMIKAIDQQRLL